ncbi:alpha/beta hydrolase [Winogradskyella schleiferi]|uniref:alpha/beta hydrolase n=1 Tax=Winogradskyella schleiferi TaxID=2686078 RepID=UPI0015BAA419|nr:alpha/beta hydrolase-fold protein [Winogradskyella schleiferi]
MKNARLFLCCCLLFVSCKNESKTNEINRLETHLVLPDVNFQHLKSAELFKGEIHRIDSFPSKYIKPRPVDVWLPEDYIEEKDYAVIYMHDGQMLFDSTATWNKQEWKVDEWASKLMFQGKTKNFIVVGVHNIPEIRWQDLFPQKALGFIDKLTKDSLRDISGSKDFKLNGDNYLKFIVKELKPKIDKTYAVHNDKKNTFVMGSSMGGLMSMYTISEYPEVFGGAACLSTHWPGAMPVENNPYPKAIFKYMEANLPKAGSHRIYFDYGNQTLDQHYPQYAPIVDDILKAKYYTELDSRNLFFKGTDHSENSWNERLNIPIEFLLGKKANNDN